MVLAEGRFASVRQILSSPDYSTLSTLDSLSRPDAKVSAGWRFWHALPPIRTRISIASDLSIPLGHAKSPGPLSGSHQKSLKTQAAFANFGAKLNVDLGHWAAE